MIVSARPHIAGGHCFEARSPVRLARNDSRHDVTIFVFLFSKKYLQEKLCTTKKIGMALLLIHGHKNKKIKTGRIDDFDGDGMGDITYYNY